MKMSRVFALALSLALPLAAHAQTGPIQGPPVSQPLVAEGTFALQLISALGLGEAATEAQAEDILASVGVAPQNGWITDYPVTPAVIGQVRNALLAAIDSKRLFIKRDQALQSFQNVIAGFNLSVALGSSNYPQAQSAIPDVDTNAVNNYYYDQGPPVVTYYPPPFDYDYLYSWYPYPFYSYGLFFPGFYVLNDFAFWGGFRGHLFVNHFGDTAFHNRVFSNRFSGSGFGVSGGIPSGTSRQSFQEFRGSSGSFGGFRGGSSFRGSGGFHGGGGGRR